jgi:hypothetical protein
MFAIFWPCFLRSRRSYGGWRHTKDLLISPHGYSRNDERNNERYGSKSTIVEKILRVTMVRD